MARAGITALVLWNFVTLDISPNFSDPQFLYPEKGTHNRTNLELLRTKIYDTVWGFSVYLLTVLELTL